ncbi:phosphotransferase [Nocardia transvalensis]|uniref:phosphotransferase n=1 Tax=Nocardia transvalensis TaxID=37333 RepID=UPI00189383F6|nr:phosphotransferase [Nocardia transvalensis]MBF6333495.1 phosphotransferase [Nocardia transvalensis]
MTSLPADLLKATDALGISLGTVVHRTDKTLLVSGALAGGQQVAVKYRLDDAEFWRTTWAHELAAYDQFTAAAAPMPAPRLIWTDDDRIMVLEWVPGQPLAADRYPAQPLTAAQIDAVLDAVTRVTGWSPPPSAVFATPFDYPARVDRYRSAGYLTDDDAATLRPLLTAVSTRELAHGDLVPPNVLLGPVRGGLAATLLDWEFCGWYLPCYDLALLDTVLGAHNPALRERIDAQVAAAGTQVPFAINLMMVITREQRIHHDLTPGPLRSTRLRLLAAAMRQARERLHAIPTGEA